MPASRASTGEVPSGRRRKIPATAEHSPGEGEATRRSGSGRKADASESPAEPSATADAPVAEGALADRRAPQSLKPAQPQAAPKTSAKAAAKASGSKSSKAAEKSESKAAKGRGPAAKKSGGSAESAPFDEDAEEGDAETTETVEGEDLSEDAVVEGDGDSAVTDADIEAFVPTLAAAGSRASLDPLQRYLYEIRDHELLDRDTERDLAIRWREHTDNRAAQRLVTSNLRLVVKIALEYRKYWMNILDLIQEGNVGLMQAVKNFDPYKNVKLSSYASFWIKAYILKFVIDNWSLVKIGTTQAQRKLFFNLKKEKERLELQGIDASPERLAERLAVKEEEVVEMSQRLAGSEFSLDARIDDDSDDRHVDFVRSGDAPIDEVMADRQIRDLFQRKLRAFRTGLSDKEAFIFDQRMLNDEPMTLQEIGNRYAISRERIRQIEERLLRKLRDYMRKELPDLGDVEFSPRDE